MAMYILGISCFYHDAAAALVKDGEVLAAALEERFTRVKHDFSFPRNAIQFCLDQAGITADQLDFVVFYDKPFVKFERILFTAMATFPRGIGQFLQAMPIWLKQKLWVRHIIRRELQVNCPILFTEHHESHAASAFFCSPFERAAVLTVDGVGEWATATIALGEKNRLRILQEIHFPNSLGLFYSAITYYLGFRVNDGEYKVMGLAPYGKPRYLNQMRELLSLHPDGSFTTNLRYFSYHYGLKMINRRFEALFGQRRRVPESPITEFHQDVAASAQVWLEEVLMALVQKAFEETHLPYLCMAGGVALNCVANGRILREGPFQDLFIQPASSDAGGAIGAALFVYHHLLGHPERKPLHHVFLGSRFSRARIRTFLKRMGVRYEELGETDLIQRTARALAEQKIVGWFQGAAEFGPRALGNRSILADPRRAEMKDIINARVKHREAFRPFAPTVLEERASEYFHLDRPSPFMLLVAKVKKPDEIPAVTHVDGTARVQTVNEAQNRRYYRLLQAFERLTNCPVLLNTSFNVRGEPIVDSPEDAYRCYQQTDLDILVLDTFWIEDKSAALGQKAAQRSLRKVEETSWLS